MNQRIKKKHIKKKWHIKTMPLGLNPVWVDKCLQYVTDEYTKLLFQKLDKAILQGGSNITNPKGLKECLSNE